MREIINVSNLSKAFEMKVKDSNAKKVKRTLVAVDNISFNVNAAEIIGFIGPNGAGKSTTIKMLTGILFPTDGNASVCGYVPWKERIKMTYDISTVFGQKGFLIPHLPVIDSYKLAGAIYDINDSILQERIDEVVNFFDISHLLKQKANSLSLGQRMICEVAIATLHRPKVLFLDEPTIGLDIVMKKKVREMILKLNKEHGTTIFITSHDIADIEKLCSRIILINHGKVMLDESMSKIKSSYLSKCSVTAVFESTVNKDHVNGIFTNRGISFEVDNDTLIFDFDKKDISTCEIISILSTIGNISDFTITNGSLENMIYDIYIAKKEV